MSLTKLDVNKLPSTFTNDKDGNSRLVFDLLLAHKWWREKSTDDTKYSDVTLNQLEDYALALEREIKRRDIKVPNFDDEMPSVEKAWSESAREAALEARRANARPAEPVSGHKTKLHYALLPRATVDRVKADIESLPPEHTEGVDDVYILDKVGDFEWTDSQGHTRASEVAGDYNPETGAIRVRASEVRMAGGAQRVLYHEFGHNVWGKHLSDDSKGDWIKIWHDKLGKMPNTYSRQRNGWQEGFAECYGRYQRRKSLDVDVESWFKINVERKGGPG